MFKKIIKFFSPVEWGFIFLGIAVVVLSFCFSTDKSVLALITSILGIIMILLNSKGVIWAQIVCMIYGVLYSIHSCMQQYYGEMLIYLFIMTPMYVITFINWLKNRNEKTASVEINSISKKEWLILSGCIAVATVGFYFLLVALNTDNPLLSAFPLITCALASYLLFRRSEYYAIAFIVNDVFLIVLWTQKLFSVGTAVLPSVMCFVIFLVIDTYSFISWKIRKRKQRE